MDKLPFRQIHLDFHTGDCMPGVGSEFSEEDFAQALTEGHVNSITLFSKCHHGWSYHPTEVNKMHPTLNTDLLGRQLAVCEKLGVRTQIYLSAGFDERMAKEHPEYLTVYKWGGQNMLEPGFHFVCFNNEDYLDLLCREAREILSRYLGRFDGLFLDICTPEPCVCKTCTDEMLSLGLDPRNDADIDKHRDIVYRKFTRRIRSVVDEFDRDLPVFFNRGIPDRDVVFSNSKHLEIESLPTGGWGYDHFPLSAAYIRCLGREYSGMTGKFHKSWGEFGGFKHPNALIYETSLSLAFGAKCCVGDQLHPLGFFDHATYKMIGKAYEIVEKKEEYCRDVTPITDIAVFKGPQDGRVGANRMLLEGHYLFDCIDEEVDMNDYKLVIFPDGVAFDSDLSDKVKKYLAKGGRILLSDKSGLDSENKFFADFGVEYLGDNLFDNNYFVPEYDFRPNGKAAYLMYHRGSRIAVKDGVTVFGNMQNSYFNRELRRFCSHSTTPNNPDDANPACVISGNVGYIAWNVFGQYAEHGAYHLKRMVLDTVDALLGDGKTAETTLQSNGVITLNEQKTENRYVCHLLYAVTKKRGSVEVIEDAIEITNTDVSLRLPRKPSKVYIAPEKRDIPWEYKDEILSFKVDAFTLHTMVVIEK